MDFIVICGSHEEVEKIGHKSVDLGVSSAGEPCSNDFLDPSADDFPINSQAKKRLKPIREISTTLPSNLRYLIP